MPRMGGCPGWSESLLDAHSFCWFCHVAAHIGKYFKGKSSKLTDKVKCFFSCVSQMQGIKCGCHWAAKYRTKLNAYFDISQQSAACCAEKSLMFCLVLTPIILTFNNFFVNLLIGEPIAINQYWSCQYVSWALLWHSFENLFTIWHSKLVSLVKYFI